MAVVIVQVTATHTVMRKLNYVAREFIQAGPIYFSKQ